MLFLPALRYALLTTTLLTSVMASAQTTYRWIDPNTGATVISDQKPPSGAKQIVKRDATDGSTERQIPYSTRQAAEKFPVTLYTTESCGGLCTQARSLLNARGIPFSNKILKSQEELADLGKLLGGEASIPSVIVGRQNIKGFDVGAWNDLLDLAGYPKTAPYGSKPSGTPAQ